MVPASSAAVARVGGAGTPAISGRSDAAWRDSTTTAGHAAAVSAVPVPDPHALRRRQAGTALGLSTAATLALHWLPWLHWLGWPLALLSTFAHELGHGLGALLLGGRFEALALFADGSGVAVYRGHFGALARAAIAACGLLGPPLAALALLAAGRHARSAHVALAVLAAVLLLVALLWAANLFTVGYCLLLGLVLGGLAWRSSAALAQVVVVFVAVQLALASFTRSDYLFTPVAHTAQGPMPSDVAQIATALWLPYWLWGGLVAALTLGLLGLGAWRFARALR